MALKYPKHFYEPIRIEIAVRQMQHEFRKLFPSLPYDLWPKLDKDIEGWFAGEPYELEPAHDFWNLFGGIARGLKLKSLLSWITAENLSWHLEQVPVERIIVTWDYPGLEFIGKAPYPVRKIKEELAKRADLLPELIQNSDEHSENFAPRDHFPIVLFDDERGGIIPEFTGYYVLDGNRRTVRAMLKNDSKIAAYVGRFKFKDDLWPDNYWFRTGILRDLIFLADKFEKEKNEGSFELVRKFYQLLLKDFDNVKSATFDITFKDFEKNERLLRELMVEDLK